MQKIHKPNRFITINYGHIFILAFLCQVLLLQNAHSQNRALVGHWKRADAKQIEREYVGKIPGEAAVPTPAVTKPKPGMPQEKRTQDQGEEDGLEVSYEVPDDDDYKDLAALLEKSRAMDTIVDGVNKVFDFPHIEVVFDMCQEANAYYDPETRRIIICYELVSALSDGFHKNSELSDDEVGTQVVASLIFTFFHELGHAAIDVFDLPIISNEEDAADRFATLILLEGSSEDDKDDLADNAIGSFDLDTAESLEDLNFADEHPVDEQRWYTMACLMVGSNREKYEYLLGENGLPEERAEACADEFTRMEKSWDQLMAPHLKKA